MALLFKTIPWPDYDCYFHEINIMNVLLHRRHLGGDLSWQVAEHDEDGALEQGGAQHRVGMSGNGDVKMYGAELKTLGWSIFMVGILRHITMTFTYSFFYDDCTRLS